MTRRDPVFDALDRLARVADRHPVGDPLPGIRRKARAHRRRVITLVTVVVAAVVASGVGAATLLDLPGRTGDHGFAASPSPAPTPTPSPPSSPTPSPPSSPAPGPTLAAYDEARADVDGDGAADTIRVMVPEADAKVGQDSSFVSKDVRLRVDRASGATAELRFGETLVPTIAGTPDLDGNGGAADVVLSFSGGDAGWLKAFTWIGEAVVQAKLAPGSPAALVDDGGLYTDPYTGSSSALVDGALISWADTGDTSAPYEVRVWTWRLEGGQLTATAAEQNQCVEPGQPPRPC